MGALLFASNSLFNCSRFLSAFSCAVSSRCDSFSCFTAGGAAGEEDRDRAPALGAADALFRSSSASDAVDSAEDAGTSCAGREGIVLLRAPPPIIPSLPRGLSFWGEGLAEPTSVVADGALFWDLSGEGEGGVGAFAAFFPPITPSPRGRGLGARASSALCGLRLGCGSASSSSSDAVS